MTCSGIGIEFFERPYRYGRFPFRISVGENVPYSGVFYGQPGFAALTDQRLFTGATSHPVNSPIKMYVNQGASSSIPTEASEIAAGYESGCANYTDYVTDVRDILENVFTVHASDSEHSATAFKIEHLKRQRVSYDLDNTSASGTADDEYVHPKPTATGPVPLGTELGASGIMDIDMDEIEYQPFTRPTKRRTTNIANTNVPTEPFYPAVIKTDGFPPLFGEQDKSVLDDLGLNVAGSGARVIRVTGDRLLENTSFKAMTAGSGSPVAATGTYAQALPWELFPAQNEMCRYIEGSDPLATVTASGRRALYNIPVLSEGVYLTTVSEDTATSGNQVQHWPKDWCSISGLSVPSGIEYHDGLYVEDRLLYDLRGLNPNQTVGGRSLQNGRLVFGHVAGPEANTLGRTIEGGDLSFAFEDKVYSHAGELSFEDILLGGNPAYGTQISVRRHTLSWATSEQSLSPVGFTTSTTTALDGSMGLRAITPGQTNGKAFGILLTYILWGFIDIWINGSAPTVVPGHNLVNFVTTVQEYKEGFIGGQPAFVPTGPPVTTTRPWAYYPDAWNMNNFFSFFITRHSFNSMCNASNKASFHFGDAVGGTAGRFHRLVAFPSAFFTRLTPAQTSTFRCYSIGFFPSWKLLCTLTTISPQVEVPTTMNFRQEQFLVAPGFTHFTDNQVKEYGVPYWDDVNEVNYLYVLDENDQWWFCKMDSDYLIYEANHVEATDAIIRGPIGILSL